MNKQEQLGLKEGEVPFEGEYRAKMSELRQAGLTPWSPADVMDARNGVNSHNPLWNNLFDTDFGVAGNKKKIYVIPNPANLRSLEPNTRLTLGGLPLDEEQEGVFYYNRSDLILDRNLDENKAREHPLWLDFADGNQDRLDKYVENTFRFGKDKYGYDTGMGIFVPQDVEPIERAVLLCRLSGRSRADGGILVSGVRLVGYAGSEVTAVAPAGCDTKSAYKVGINDYDAMIQTLSKNQDALSGKNVSALAEIVQKYLSSRKQ